MAFLTEVSSVPLQQALRHLQTAFHVSNILAKPGVSGRREAAAVAHRLGLFPPDAPTASAAG